MLIALLLCFSTKTKAQSFFIQADYPLLFSKLKGVAAAEAGYEHRLFGGGILLYLNGSYTLCKGLEKDNLHGLGITGGLGRAMPLNASMNADLFLRFGYSNLQNSIIATDGFYGEAGFNLFHTSISNSIGLNFAYRQYWLNDLNYSLTDKVNGKFGALLMGVTFKIWS